MIAIYSRAIPTWIERFSQTSYRDLEPRQREPAQVNTGLLQAYGGLSGGLLGPNGAQAPLGRLIGNIGSTRRLPLVDALVHGLAVDDALGLNTSRRSVQASRI